MNFGRKQTIRLVLSLYWVLNAANTAYLSREPGYYPPQVRPEAKLLAKMQPYPWSSIVGTWALLAILTGAIYWILINTTRQVTSVLIFSFFIAFVHAIVVPTDIGGVHYAISEFAVYTFICALCTGVYRYLSQRFKLKKVD